MAPSSAWAFSAKNPQYLKKPRMPRLVAMLAARASFMVRRAAIPSPVSSLARAWPIIRAVTKSTAVDTQIRTRKRGSQNA